VIFLTVQDALWWRSLLLFNQSKPSVDYQKAHTYCYKEGKRLRILKPILKEAEAFAHAQGSRFIRLVSSTDLTGNVGTATWQDDASTGKVATLCNLTLGLARQDRITKLQLGGNAST
jgi:hypothetical protein